MSQLKLNVGQQRAVDNIKIFLDLPIIGITDDINFVLSGRAGTGKTTVIVNTFNELAAEGIKYNVAFCAFTNKATDVLRNMSHKYDIQFRASFMTIHKLLQLEPKYLDNEDELAFEFDRSKIIAVSNFDVIVFDECSTVSKELYKYIEDMWEYIMFKSGKKLKYIWLGDRWQLPPIGETISVVFLNASYYKWNSVILTEMMRSNNELITGINNCMAIYQPILANGSDNDLSEFIQSYPHNMTGENVDVYINSVDRMVHDYYDYCRDKSAGIRTAIILTYSRNNKDKLNSICQLLIDSDADRKSRNTTHVTEFYSKEQKSVIKITYECILFFAGDRCCIASPITLRKIAKHGDDMYTTGEITGTTLYNGEIFEVAEAEDVKIRTPLSGLYNIPEYFNGQRLCIKKIDSTETYDILHIKLSELKEARSILKKKASPPSYLNTMTIMKQSFPSLDYGYAMTIYKAQGSEYNAVYVNMLSIKCSTIGRKSDLDYTDVLALYKATYTAISRAQDTVSLFWY